MFVALAFCFYKALSLVKCSVVKAAESHQIVLVGKTLKQVEEPDDIESILVNRATLPKGDDEEDGIETRPVVDIEIIRHVTEYQAQVLMNKKTGERYVAPFPEGVTKAVQYGNKLKAHVVYMSPYQLLPYKRVQAFFANQMGIPISDCLLLTSFYCFFTLDLCQLKLVAIWY
ncbi:MAG: hypothetical protein ACI9FJ_001504, partial [Alteromonadaceae bacterium]